jgi:hypothetical protein
MMVTISRVREFMHRYMDLNGCAPPFIELSEKELDDLVREAGGTFCFVEPGDPHPKRINRIMDMPVRLIPE